MGLRRRPEINEIDGEFLRGMPAAEALPATGRDPMFTRMLIIMGTVLLLTLSFAFIHPKVNLAEVRHVAETAQTAVAESVVVQQASLEAAVPTAGLSPIFTREVQHWGPHIVRWAAMYHLDPNQVATIMQVESCGDPQAMSGAGARGLFQVMPFHFAAGEDMFDPEINAMRGMNYFAERLVQTNNDVGYAFAGYNGGHRAAASGWDQWADETRRYYRWTTGVYSDALAGLAVSPTLQEWLSAGGASLCRQAAARLGLTP